MDWLTFTSEAIKALAWPAVAIVVACKYEASFKRLALSLAQFVRRMRSVEMAGVKAQAAEAVEAAKLVADGEAEKLKEEIAQSSKGEPERRALIERLSQVQAEANRLRALSLTLAKDQQAVRTFYEWGTGSLSPGRRAILEEIAKILGPERIAGSPLGLIQTELSRIVREVESEGKHWPPLNGGAIAGLRSVGLVADDGSATTIGAAQLRAVAHDLATGRH